MSTLCIFLALFAAQQSVDNAIELGIAERLGQATRAHMEQVTAVDYSLDGKFALSASEDGIIKVWNTENGQLLTELSGHKETVRFAFFIAPNSDIRPPTTLGTIRRGDLNPSLGAIPPIVSASNDGTLRIWNTAEGTEATRLFDASLYLHAGAISPDGKLLAAGSRLGGRIYLFDLEKRVLLRELPAAEGMLFTLAFSQNGQRLASAYGFEGEVVVHEVASGRMLLSKRYENHVNDLAWSPDGQTLVLGMHKRALLVNANDGELRDQFKVRLSPTPSLMFAQDGQSIYFVAPPQGGLRSWSFASRKDSALVNSKNLLMPVFDLSPDGKQLISGGFQHDVRFFDMDHGDELFTGPGHQQAVRTLAFNADGQRLISGAMDGSINLWSTRSGKLTEATSQHKYRVAGVGILGAKGSGLSAANNRLILWDKRGDAGWTKSDDSSSIMTSLALANDGKLAWTGHARGQILSWVPAGKKTGTLLAELDDMITDLALSPDQQWLAAICKKGTLHIFSTESGASVYSSRISAAPPTPQNIAIPFNAIALPILKSVKFLGNDTVITADGQGKLQCRNWTTDKLIWSHPGQNDLALSAMTLAPDGSIAVTATSNGLSFWAAADGRKILDLDLPVESAISLAFSPNGKILATGMQNSTILLWKLSKIAGLN